MVYELSPETTPVDGYALSREEGTQPWSCAYVCLVLKQIMEVTQHDFPRPSEWLTD